MGSFEGWRTDDGSRKAREYAESIHLVATGFSPRDVTMALYREIDWCRPAIPSGATECSLRGDICREIASRKLSRSHVYIRALVPLLFQVGSSKKAGPPPRWNEREILVRTILRLNFVASPDSP